MKKLLLFLAFSSLAISNAQNVIVKKDGTSLPVYSVTVENSGKELKYLVNSIESKLSVAELDSAVIGEKVFSRFEGKKAGYYLLARQGTKKLGVMTKVFVKYVGGFQRVVKKYEVVLSENGKVVKTLKLTASKRDSEIAKRKAFFDLATHNFGNCVPFMERLTLYEHPEDKDYLVILEYLENPTYNKCK